MTYKELLDIYIKEREYQKCCFGEYKDIQSLNLSSFILFIEEYLKKAKHAYCGAWKKELPQWLEDCKEFKEGSAPVDAYEELIKIFTLTGAALETFSSINAEKWRENPEEDWEKWKK